MENKKTICYECAREFLTEEGGTSLCPVCKMEWEMELDDESEEDIKERLFNERLEEMSNCECGSLLLINAEIVRVADCCCG